MFYYFLFYFFLFLSLSQYEKNTLDQHNDSFHFLLYIPTTALCYNLKNCTFDFFKNEFSKKSYFQW